jgi:subtilase family serine protease
MQKRRIIAVAATAATVLATTVTVAGTASASPGRHALPDSAPHWLAKAKQSSAVAKSTSVDFTVVLGMRNAAGAKSLLQRVSDPRSKSYGKWLTNAQFRAQFAPAKSDVAAVQSWLRSSGLRVENSLPSGMAIEASGSAAQVEKVFATSLKNYRYKGTTVSTNTSTLSLAASTPARVLSAVSGVFGLEQHPEGAREGPPRPAAGQPLRSRTVLVLLRREGRDRQAFRLREEAAVRGVRLRSAAVPGRLR